MTTTFIMDLCGWVLAVSKELVNGTMVLLGTMKTGTQDLHTPAATEKPLTVWCLVMYEAVTLRINPQGIAQLPNFSY